MTDKVQGVQVREQAEPQHEYQDASASGLLKFLAIMVTFLVVVHVVVYFLLVGSQTQGLQSSQKVSRERVQKYPHPRLEANEAEEFQDLEAEQKAQLRGYRWVNKKENRLQIPIEEAMKLVAEQ